MNMLASIILLTNPSLVTVPISPNIASTVFLLPSLNSGIDEIDSANSPKKTPIVRPVLFPMNMLATIILLTNPSLVTVSISLNIASTVFLLPLLNSGIDEMNSANAPKNIRIRLVTDSKIEDERFNELTNSSSVNVLKNLKTTSFCDSKISLAFAILEI